PRCRAVRAAAAGRTRSPGSGRPLYVSGCCRPRLQAEERAVAGADAVFDMRAICPGCEHSGMRVLIVEDEPYLAEAIRDGLRLAAIATDIAGDGDSALELL